MTESAIRPGDAAGAETLEIMAMAPRYNRWQYAVIAPWIGQRVLEVGAGVGNMSAHIVAAGRAHVVLADTDAWYRGELVRRFRGRPEVSVESLTLPDPGAPLRLASHQLDTVVALNVVEHIDDHVVAIRTMRELVRPGGRVIILVPALPGIYGTLDRELGHFRRYTRDSLSAACQAAGLRVERLAWFNRVGTVGWWFNARVRKAGRIPLMQLKAFDLLVPFLRLERFLPLPFGQSLFVVGRRDA
ncbi:MAG: class I SAM-dependent methyltransferase [Gemmatimonadales bacterium]